MRETIKRDLRRISQNLVLVVFPFNSGREEQQAALRNWDLWGPMVRARRVAVNTAAEHTVARSAAHHARAACAGPLLLCARELPGGKTLTVVPCVHQATLCCLTSEAASAVLHAAAGQLPVHRGAGAVQCVLGARSPPQCV